MLLDDLLKDLYNSKFSPTSILPHQIMSLVNEILQLEEQFEDESVRLNCCSQLVCSILRCVGNLNDEERQLLEGSFNILPFVQTNDLQVLLTVFSTLKFKLIGS